MFRSATFSILFGIPIGTVGWGGPCRVPPGALPDAPWVLPDVPETLPDSSQKHPGAQLRTRNIPSQAEVAPERAGPGLPTTFLTPYTFT